MFKVSGLRFNVLPAEVFGGGGPQRYILKAKRHRPITSRYGTKKPPGSFLKSCY